MSIGNWLFAAIVAGSAVPTLVAAGDYTVDPEHTYPSFEMSHMGISVWRGKFNRTSGTASFDRAARTGTATIRVDTASIDFGLDKMNEFAVGPDWLNVGKFPVMTYQGKFRYTGDTPSAMDGQLTLLGVTRPLTLTLRSFKCIEHPMLKREVCGADAEGDLNRADFGMTEYSDGEAGKLHLRIQVEVIKNP